MAAKDLITLVRAYFNLPGISADPIVSALITASDAIKCCRRDSSKNYDELYNGNGDLRLSCASTPSRASSQSAIAP